MAGSVASDHAGPSARSRRRGRTYGVAIACCLSTTVAGAQEARCPAFAPAEYRRFIDVTLQDEDDRDARTFVIRWESDIRLEVRGTPTDGDRSHLKTVIDELEVLAPGIRFTIGEGDPNFFVHYVPIDSFGDVITGWGIEPGDLSTACATFYYWRRDGVIVEARVLLPTDPFDHGCGADADYVLSLTREEITQALGFPNDVDWDRESIFDQYGDPRDYSETDRRFIQALYCEDVRAGMTEVALWSTLVPDGDRFTRLLERASAATATADDVAAVQSVLIDLGYKPGPVDGVLDQATIDAIADAIARFVKPR